MNNLHRDDEKTKVYLDAHCGQTFRGWRDLLLAAKPRDLAIAVLLLYGFLVAIRLAIHGGDASTFISAGDYFTNNRELLSPISVLSNSVGYDGQFYYRLALNPYTSAAHELGITLDNPPFRMQRIVYPLLVWAASFGQPSLVPWMMILVNLVGVGLITYFAALIAQYLGFSSWMSGLVAAYPGFFVTLNRDTAEIVATAFGLMALFLALRRSTLPAVALASIAVLARETALLYLLGFGVLALLGAWKQKRYISTIWLVYVVPVLVFVGWQSFLSYHWGMPPHSGGVQDLGWPMIGLARLLATNLSEAIIYSPNWMLELAHRGYTMSAALLCFYLMGLAVTGVSMSITPLPLKLAWGAYTLLMVCLSNVIWLTPGEYLRAYTECYVMGAFLLMGARGPTIRRALLAVGVIWVPTAVVFIR